ncbi:hypothetical protein B9X95_00640 [Acinetobacter baumannii]|uniref:Uncharacterized protein n=1 Tax=Acinetobacter baumannii TaxID=470 RepID=A0A241ZJ88_ACIBA|nr:hypothetical protein B9X95_00640 [Acinetobacter baumannii]
MIEHLDQNYGLEYVGLGASLLFFIKTSKFDANKTPQLLNELSNFYQFSQTTHNQLEQHLSNHEYLILPYVESLEVFEPYRVCRRVNILRDYPDDKIKIYP